MTGSVTRTATVAASIDEVAATLARFDRLADWASSVDHCRAMTDPAAGPEAVRRVQMGRRAVLEHVVDWDLPRTLAYRIEGLPPLAGTVINRWTLTARGAQTAVELTSTVDAGPKPPARIVEKVLPRKLAGIAEGLLVDLVAHHVTADAAHRTADAARS